MGNGGLFVYVEILRQGVTDPPDHLEREIEQPEVIGATESGVQTRELTSSDARYTSGEVADDCKGLVFADEGKVDIVVCEVGGEVFYTACARCKQGEFITGLLWDMIGQCCQRQSVTRQRKGGYLAICEQEPGER